MIERPELQVRWLICNFMERKSLLGLVLVGIAPTVSVITGFGIEPGLIAIVVFILTKLWLLALPAWWRTKIDGEPLSLSYPKNGGWAMAVGLGMGIFIIIVSTYIILGDLLISKDDLWAILEPNGLTEKSTFIMAMLFWIFVNSVIEEYVFRWFITEKAESLFAGGVWAPVALSASIFTIHHVVAMSFFISPLGNLLASTGVWIGGAIFSWLYLRYRSIWIPWLTHAFADVAIFGIAYYLLFL
jgi:membrane protease YdiL (CAAX protease family)